MQRLNLGRSRGSSLWRVLTSQTALAAAAIVVIVGASVTASSLEGNDSGRPTAENRHLPNAPTSQSTSAAPPSVAFPSELTPTPSPPSISVPDPGTAPISILPPAPDAKPAPSSMPASTSAVAVPGTASGRSPNGSVTSGGSVTYTAFVTGYSYFDNTPPGSAGVSNPVLHQTAGGVGTYADPITVAVGHSMASGHDVLDFAAGTRFYIAGLHRYFIVEDTCGDGNSPEDGPCHDVSSAPAGTQIWLDVWTGGQGGTQALSNSCANTITRDYTVIRNPAADLPIVSGAINNGTTCRP